MSKNKYCLTVILLVLISDVAGEYTGTVQFRIACEESY